MRYDTTIWKYELEITDRQTILMPGGAKILAVGDQDGTLCLWAECDPGNLGLDRVIAIVGTGHPMPGMGRPVHIGTVLMPPFVWHVFEVVNADS